MEEFEEVTHNKDDFSNEILSHSHIVGPSKYVKCRFDNADMNGVRFDQVSFLNCSFCSTDMSSSEFSNCKFIDCNFNHASLSTSVFSGCEFSSTSGTVGSPFSRASLNSSLFMSSNANRTKFINIRFSDISFRQLSFLDSDFSGCTFSHVPFEGTIFRNCSFDDFDLRSGTVKGIQLYNCRAAKFKTIIEKTFSIVGLVELIDSADFEIYKESSGDVILVSNLNGLLKLVNDNKDKFALQGCLYEYLNCVVIGYEIEKRNLPSKEKTNSLISYKESISELIFLELQRYVTLSAENGRVATLANINFALNILIMTGGVTQSLLSQVIRLIELSKQFRYSFQHLSEAFLKFENLKRSPSHDYICITFIDSSYSSMSYKESSNFSLEVAFFMEACGIETYSIYSRTEGSIVEKLILKKENLISTYSKLIGVLFILGFDMSVSSTSSGVDYNIKFSISGIFKEETSFEQAISEVEKLQNFRKPLELSNPVELENAAQEIKKRDSLINKIKSGHLAIDSQEAFIEQVLPKDSTNIFLLNSEGL